MTMTDTEAKALALVERLRTKYCCSDWDKGCNCETSADLIETQAREIERLRKALEGVLTGSTDIECGERVIYAGAVNAVRAALAGAKP